MVASVYAFMVPAVNLLVLSLDVRSLLMLSVVTFMVP